MGAIMPVGCALLPRHERVTAAQSGGKRNNLAGNIETIWRETKQLGK